MERRSRELHDLMALYRGYLEDGMYPNQTEFYTARLFEAEDELEWLEFRKQKI